MEEVSGPFDSPTKYPKKFFQGQVSDFIPLDPVKKSGVGVEEIKKGFHNFFGSVFCHVGHAEVFVYHFNEIAHINSPLESDRLYLR